MVVRNVGNYLRVDTTLQTRDSNTSIITAVRTLHHSVWSVGCTKLAAFLGRRHTIHTSHYIMRAFGTRQSGEITFQSYRFRCSRRHKSVFLISTSLTGVCPDLCSISFSSISATQLITTSEEHWTRTSRITKCVREEKCERRAGA